MTNDRKTTPEHVTSLAEYEVFVFGSNKEGQHWGGAAKFAHDNFGAEWGVGIGMTGQSNVSLPESFWNIIEMTAIEAIRRRHSVRRYRTKPISDEIQEQLRQAIQKVNTEGALHVQLVIGEPKAFSGRTPSWFYDGVEAARLAPTAVNQQKFFIEFLGKVDGGLSKVRISKGFSMIGYTQMDMGIAKLHFEIGAGKENFDWVTE